MIGFEVNCHCAGLRSRRGIWYNYHMHVVCQEKDDCTAGGRLIPRLLVHVHVFYPAIWPELADCVDNFAAVVGWGHLDVRVTVSELHQEVVDLVRLRLPHARVEVVENRGYDVAPYLKILDEVNLDDYDYVVKLHTKRDVNCWINFRKLQGSAWRRELLSFCSSQESVLRTIIAFRKHDRMGMTAGMKLFDPCGVGCSCDFYRAGEILRSLGMRSRRNCAVYGAMFIVRAKLLKPLQGMFALSQFDETLPTNPHSSYGLAGDIEMVFAMLVEAQGFYVGSGKFPGVIDRTINLLKGVCFRCLRFLSACFRVRLMQMIY